MGAGVKTCPLYCYNCWSILRFVGLVIQIGCVLLERDEDDYEKTIRRTLKNIMIFLENMFNI